MIDIKYSLPIGTKLKAQNEYTITSAIGQGGFGITYIATANVKIGNITATARFAVKEFFLNEKCKRADDGVTLIPLDDSFAEEIKSSLKDFITEGERINKLCRADEHIVNVNEVFSANNTAYFVMEYIDGGNLVDLVHQKGKLNEEEAKEIIIPIANAIGKLHEEHVLHLDIKPENIMMRKDDAGKLFPVIIDFGISMHFNKQGKATTRSKNGAVSIGYSPVEQYGQVTSFAPKVDIYALGATMFYMLTGNNPQQAFDVTKDYLEHSLTETDETVKKAVMQAMSKEKTMRTASVEKFINELSTSQQTDAPKKTQKFETSQQDVDSPIKTFVKENIKLICSALAGVLATLAIVYIPEKCSDTHLVGIGATNDTITDNNRIYKDDTVSGVKRADEKHVNTGNQVTNVEQKIQELKAALDACLVNYDAVKKQKVIDLATELEGCSDSKIAAGAAFIKKWFIDALGHKPKADDVKMLKSILAETKKSKTPAKKQESSTNQNVIL